MSDEAKFSMTIERPCSRGISVMFGHGSDSIVLVPSFLSDALGDLAVVAADIARSRGRLPETVRLWWTDEPGGWEWRIETRDSDMLMIRVFEQRDQTVTARSAAKEIAQYQVPAGRFCRSVLRAFDALAKNDATGEYEPPWRYPFPQRAIASLRAALRCWR